MDKLLAYINELDLPRRADFERLARTSIGYLRKSISAKNRLGCGVCVAIEEASAGEVTCDSLRPDIVWVRVPDPLWPHPGGRPLVDHTRKAA